METQTIIIISTILYLLSGSASFIYWWTKQHDFTSSEIMLCVLSALIGPIAWFVGRSIHGENDIVIFKKRK